MLIPCDHTQPRRNQIIPACPIHSIPVHPSRRGIASGRPPVFCTSIPAPDAMPLPCGHPATRAKPNNSGLAKSFPSPPPAVEAQHPEDSLSLHQHPCTGCYAPTFGHHQSLHQHPCTGCCAPTIWTPPAFAPASPRRMLCPYIWRPLVLAPASLHRMLCPYHVTIPQPGAQPNNSSLFYPFHTHSSIA
jgi:hypothetical protein